MALPVLDMDAYVADFGRTVVPGYRRGIADAEFPADAGLARSIIPPGTSATRDFSQLAPRIPDVLMDMCVGCMACVNACPDSAILACVVPESQVAPAVETFAASQPQPAVAAAELTRHFAATQKYGDVPAKRGEERGAFGLFVDPGHCKGCAECVEVCAALGHDALVMIDKVEDEPASGESTLERYGRDIAFFRSLPPTPAVYRNEKALADIMLGEHALGYVGGAGSCAGCGEGTALRMLVRRDPQLHGPESMGIVAATGCNTVFAARTRTTRTSCRGRTRCSRTPRPSRSASALAGTRRAAPDRPLWVIGGDGAMYDIGFQALSRMFASGADIKVFVLDTQVYSNTGGQASTASFTGQNTKMSRSARCSTGKQERRKEIAQIVMSTRGVYVAQTTLPTSTTSTRRSWRRSSSTARPSSSSTPPASRSTASPTTRRAARRSSPSTRGRSRCSSTTRAAAPRSPSGCRSRATRRCATTGRPAPDGAAIDFLTFARTEGRFAPHFAADGTATPEIAATRDERLANWRTLQELAGQAAAA